MLSLRNRKLKDINVGPFLQTEVFVMISLYRENILNVSGLAEKYILNKAEKKTLKTFFKINLLPRKKIPLEGNQTCTSLLYQFELLTKKILFERLHFIHVECRKYVCFRAL